MQNAQLKSKKGCNQKFLFSIDRKRMALLTVVEKNVEKMKMMMMMMIIMIMLRKNKSRLTLPLFRYWLDS